MYRPVNSCCLLLFICLGFSTGCEPDESDVSTSDAGINERLDANAGGQCGLEGEPVSVCTEGGDQCRESATATGVADSQSCLIDAVRSAGSETFICGSSDDCRVIDFGLCGEAVVVSADRFSELDDVTCRLRQCDQYITEALDGGQPACENEAFFINPMADCVSGVCQIVEGPSEPTCPSDDPACQDAGM
ncbi:MAG: hypothetical protein ACON3Z_15500 [Bradymonadia bacterium]